MLWDETADLEQKADATMPGAVGCDDGLRRAGIDELTGAWCESKVTGRSLRLDGYSKAHGHDRVGIMARVGGGSQTGGGLFNLGHPGES